MSCIGCVGKTRILKHTQFLCQFYESRKLNERIGVEGCGVVVWFGKYTGIAFLVLLFGFTQPIPVGAFVLTDHWVWFDVKEHKDSCWDIRCSVNLCKSSRETQSDG